MPSAMSAEGDMLRDARSISPFVAFISQNAIGDLDLTMAA
jgi:hypothetical protein